MATVYVEIGKTEYSGNPPTQDDGRSVAQFEFEFEFFSISRIYNNQN